MNSRTPEASPLRAELARKIARFTGSAEKRVTEIPGLILVRRTAPTAPCSMTYEPSVAVTVALLRYGTGMPHYRLARLQQSLGVPLPESTQWELMRPVAEVG